MRLSNRNKKPVYNFINTLLIMFLIGGITIFTLEQYKLHILDGGEYIFIFVPLILLSVFYLTGRQIFEYDSDGEALHFRNSNIIPFLSKNLSDEFPKYKLISYEVISILFIKRLYITITSKNSGTAMLKYEISYLTKKQTNDLKFSLSKVIKATKSKDSNKE
ncbi:hypothetical protein N0B16_05480 [Chryseobacterium sp. GMJ5]|uniref:DUF304 domain-containing protein n=1 Tax=Chryseobacterium gilvum TaxID=2976534 RepID=A0ABT2VV58_9FLAO|nr:hypothetical protein [Chryseobacterium gilvum]MCU7613882.1 hypothetical protein [Chryseobacterium gilvum]